MNDYEKIRQIILKNLNGYSVQVYLFGSRATGKARPHSDFDIGIMPESKLPIGLLSSIKEALEESNIIYKIDLIDLSETEESFRERILKEGILWRD